MKKNILLILFLTIIVSVTFVPSLVHAQINTTNNSEVKESNNSDSELDVVSIGKESILITDEGVEFDNYITFVSGLLSLALFILVLISFLRTGNKRLIFVSIAFIVFSIKSFLMTIDLFTIKPWWIDIVAAILDFVILMSFFFGILKR